MHVYIIIYDWFSELYCFIFFTCSSVSFIKIYSLQVSWIRRLDFQLLTVGLSTYSSDDRFLVEHARHMGHWSLRIKSVRDEDRGLYECQLSIYPTQSIFVELKVVGKCWNNIFDLVIRCHNFVTVDAYEFILETVEHCIYIYVNLVWSHVKCDNWNYEQQWNRDEGLHRVTLNRQTHYELSTHA